MALALDGVSLSLDRGGSLAVVGGSGAGKSTLALLLLGLLPPAARVVRGAVRFEGTDMLSLDERSLRALRGRRVAMVFQDAGAALHPLRTALDQVAEPLRIQRGAGESEARKEALRTLALAGIADPEAVGARYPHQLSGGTRQRVLVAMAIACQPALLVADEPTSSLDVTVQAAVLDRLEALRRERGMALLHVTHDLPLAAARADEVAVLHAGRLVERGPSTAVLARPAHPYTAALTAAWDKLAGLRSGATDPVEGRLGGALSAEAPRGCHLRARCPIAKARCAEETPRLLPLSPTRAVRCHAPLVAAEPT